MPSAAGFIPQSLMAYWFHLQFGAEPAILGAIFFGANLLAAVSSLSAARIAARFGLINTMVFTHLPSNVLLILVPLMPTLPLAIAVLLLRFSLSQMDVPTRQSYVMAVVDPDERSAAAGVTGIARTTGAAISPSISSVLRRRAPASRPSRSSWPAASRSSTTCCSTASSGPFARRRTDGRRQSRAKAELGSARPSRRGRPGMPRRHQMNSDDGQHHGHRDGQVERLEGVPDVDPVRAEHRPGVDQQHRPEERAGRRVER